MADVAAGAAFGVDPAGVVVGAEIVVAGGGIDEQVPDDGENGTGNSDQGFELAPSFDQAPVAGAEEGVGLGSGPASPSTL